MDVIQDLSLRQSRGIKGGGSDRSIFRDQRQSVPNFLIILKIFYAPEGIGNSLGSNYYAKT